MKKLLLSVFVLFLLVVYSCKKEDPAPKNPYDSVDYSHPNSTDQPLDPNSIAGLHKNILFPVCANPGCHDGTFEPDFRTVESAYTTLVYHPVNKVTLDSVKIFSNRVIPHNIADSWLIERLTTLTSDYMPSNGEKLSQTQIDHFKTWINNGCPDINGNLPVKPDLQPNIVAYIAIDSVNNRLDTARLNGFPFNPFVVRLGVNMTIAFIALDTADGSSAVDPGQFTVKQIQFSTNKNDFTSATTINAFFYLIQYSAWLVSVPTSSWSSGTTVYFRIVVNDGNHVANSVFPRNESIDYYKTLYAFYLQ